MAAPGSGLAQAQDLLSRVHRRDPYSSIGSFSLSQRIPIEPIAGGAIVGHRYVLLYHGKKAQEITAAVHQRLIDISRHLTADDVARCIGDDAAEATVTGVDTARAAEQGDSLDLSQRPAKQMRLDHDEMGEDEDGLTGRPLWQSRPVSPLSAVDIQVELVCIEYGCKENDPVKRATFYTTAPRLGRQAAAAGVAGKGIQLTSRQAVCEPSGSSNVSGSSSCITGSESSVPRLPLASSSSSSTSTPPSCYEHGIYDREYTYTTVDPSSVPLPPFAPSLFMERSIRVYAKHNRHGARYVAQTAFDHFTRVDRHAMVEHLTRYARIADNDSGGVHAAAVRDGATCPAGQLPVPAHDVAEGSSASSASAAADLDATIVLQSSSEYDDGEVVAATTAHTGSQRML